MNKSKNAASAFTLIELSVVLIVLSILIGSVLVGRKIIDRSRVQNAITEIVQMQKAISVFSDTYGALPGDLTRNDIAQYPALWAFDISTYNAKVAQRTPLPWEEKSAWAATIQWYYAPAANEATQTSVSCATCTTSNVVTFYSGICLDSAAAMSTCISACPGGTCTITYSTPCSSSGCVCSDAAACGVNYNNVICSNTFLSYRKCTTPQTTCNTPTTIAGSSCPGGMTQQGSAQQTTMTLGSGAGSTLVTNAFNPGNDRVELYESCYGMRMLAQTGFIGGVPESDNGGSTLCNYTDNNPTGDFGNMTKKAKFSADVGVFFADATYYATSGNNRVVAQSGNSMISGVSPSASALFTLYPELMSNVGGLGDSVTDNSYFTNLIAIYNVRNLSAGAVSAYVAQMIDTKMDDGKPYSGKIVAGMYPASDINSTYGPSNAPSKSAKSTTRQYCTDIPVSCVNAGNCTSAQFAAAKYQQQSQSSLEQGCNIFGR